jgi:UDP-N-acetylglucosamine:LPS N-acetylglucosamine transferase
MGPAGVKDAAGFGEEIENGSMASDQVESKANGEEATSDFRANAAPQEALIALATSTDNPAVQLANYVARIGHHIALDLHDSIEWVGQKLGRDESDEVKEQEADAGSTRDTHASEATSERPQAPVVARRRPKILILMSDTGGGHRASANAIKSALLQYESDAELEVKIVDVLEDYTLWFSNRLYSWYVTYPVVWKTIYNTTKATAGKPWPIDTSKFLEPTVRSGFRRCIAAEKPDLVLSVHPILQCIPLDGFMPANPPRPIPFVTCVTDLGDAHPWWFNSAVDRVFVPTRAMKETALEHGLAAGRVEVIGLPLREGFWNVDTSPANKSRVRIALGLGGSSRKVVLVMGGGDGMGKLEHMVHELAAQLACAPFKSRLIIVCGRNAALAHKLRDASWPAYCRIEPQAAAAAEHKGAPDAQFDEPHATAAATALDGAPVEAGLEPSEVCSARGTGGVRGRGPTSTPPVPHQYPEEVCSAQEVCSARGTASCAPHPTSTTERGRGPEAVAPEVDNDPAGQSDGEGGKGGEGGEGGGYEGTDEGEDESRVVVGVLGFVSNVEDYMVASDLMVSKAGPGAISEAAACALPLLLFDFLPGQVCVCVCVCVWCGVGGVPLLLVDFWSRGRRRPTWTWCVNAGWGIITRPQSAWRRRWWSGCSMRCC